MADALETARKFLESLQRFELSTLLEECSIAIVETVGPRDIDDEWFPRVREEVARVVAPTPIDEAIRKLPDYDRKRIAEAIANSYLRERTFDDLDVVSVKHEVVGVAALIAELIIHREMMIDVATGGQRIQEVNDYYRAREARVRDQLPADIKYENPHEDLWAWYRHWSDNLPQYKDRRIYARQIFGRGPSQADYDPFTGTGGHRLGTCRSRVVKGARATGASFRRGRLSRDRFSMPRSHNLACPSRF